MELPQEFIEYAALFKENGFSLWMVGGTSRDVLLGIKPEDLDFVTDASPEQMQRFLLQADYSFQKYGSIKIFCHGKEIDITTLREEGEYLDNRHPSFIKWTKSTEIDSARRDFTINAIYIDLDGNIIDYHHGVDDLRKGTLRFIGDPEKRVREDPLRIIRAERFAKRLGFSFEQKTWKAIENGRELIEKLNPEKVRMERKKK